MSSIQMISRHLVMAVVLAAVLAGCNSGAAKQPTAIDFGDSVSLGYSGPARFDLNDKVDYRHNPWVDENIAAQNSGYFFGKKQNMEKMTRGLTHYS